MWLANPKWAGAFLNEAETNTEVEDLLTDTEVEDLLTDTEVEDLLTVAVSLSSVV